jgi:hypothetical protein
MKRAKPRRSTLPARRPLPPRPGHATPPRRPDHAPPPARAGTPRLAAPPPPKRDVARILDDSETSLLDVIDNLLNRGVLLNADLVLALAGVDLVYLRLSALLCAADRVMPRAGSR